MKKKNETKRIEKKLFVKICNNICNLKNKPASHQTKLKSCTKFYLEKEKKIKAKSEY